MRQTACALVLMVLLGGTAAHANTAPQHDFFSVSPKPPSWVTSATPVDTPLPTTSETTKDVSWLHYEQHAKLDGELNTYRRKRFLLLSEAGVDQFKYLSFGVQPLIERITLHHVRIHRKGQTVDALDQTKLKVYQREEELEKGLVTDSRSIVLFLDDIREGDIIDYAMTYHGNPPLLHGRISRIFPFAFHTPVGQLHYSLQVPVGKQLYFKSHNTHVRPEVTVANGIRTYRWSAQKTKALHYEDKTPGWYNETPHIRVTDFANWREVVDLVEPLYRELTVPSPAITATARFWKTQHKTQKQQLFTAARFVQEKIRYAGFEAGIGAIKPKPPASTMAKRYGDCKDKTLLLVTLLQQMGIKAAPAAVHHAYGKRLPEMLASPFVFSHMIVRAEADKQIFWIDPTTLHQGNNPDELVPPPFHWALVLEPGVTQLEKIPQHQPVQPEIELRETFDVSARSSTVQLEARTTYRGLTASQRRYGLLTKNRRDFDARALNFYTMYYPKISQYKPTKIKDDQKNNQLTVTHYYEIDDFWSEPNLRRITAWLVDRNLPFPDTIQRKKPLALSHPMFVRHHLQIILPDDLEFKTGDLKVESKGFVLKAKQWQDQEILNLRYDLEYLADHIAAGDITAYLDKIKEARRNTDYYLQIGPLSRQNGENEDGDAFFGFALMGGGCLGSFAVGALVGALLSPMMFP